MADEETRPLRMCDSCGGVDDHPRHVYSQGPGDAPTSDEVAEKALLNASPETYREILRQVRDDSVTQKHMDCCKADGCPDGTCNIVTEGAEDLKGADLVEHLVSLPTTVTQEG
jgi:hypothetical protein